MAALDFPASSASPWTAPNGVIYIWNAGGYWEAAPTDTDYLRLDATNGPVTGPLTFKGQTTHEAGVSVTGGGSRVAAYGIGQGGDSLVLTAGGASTISAKDGRVVALGGLDAYGDAIVSIRTVPHEKYTGDLYGMRFNVPDAPNLTGSSNVYGFESRYNATKSLNSFTGFIAQKGTWGAGVGATELKGFAVEDGFNNDAGTAYGFYSNISDNGDVANPFNFYAAGSAPNFFAGSLVVNNTGPNHTRHVKLIASGNPFFDWATDLASERPVLSITNQYGNISQIVAVSTETIFKGIGANTVRIQSPSDYRLKTDVDPISSASDVIKALNPITYRMIAHPDELMSGFIAHELQDHVPEAVRGTKDATEAIGTHTDAEGVVTTDVTEPETLPYGETWVQTGTRPRYQGVDQTKLIPLLTKALQEALERIENLEQQLGI